MSKPQKTKEGTWRIQFFGADGKRRSATFATMDAARRALRESEVRADEDRIRRDKLGAGALTVAAAWQAFKAGRKRDANNTERRFLRRGAELERTYTRHIEPHLGTVMLCDLTPAVLRQWIGKLAETTTGRPGEKNEGKRTLAAASIRAIVTTLRQIAKANDVPLVVMLGQSLKQKRRRSKPRAFQSIEDVRAFLESCRDPWFKVAAALACYTGARLGEIASLRWRHLGESTITIALSWEGPLKARYEDDDEAARVVPVAPELTAILAAWRKATKGKDADHVVLVNGKRPLREGYDDVAQKTRSACKRAGLAPLTFHSLRASYATLAAAQGLPVSTLQVLLGHADIGTTGIYLRPDSAQAALDPRAKLGARELHGPPNLAAALPN